MLRTVKTVVQPDGTVQLLEPVRSGSARRALVTILEERDEDNPTNSAPLGAAALAADWSRPEEDAAWAYLQRAR